MAHAKGHDVHIVGAPCRNLCATGPCASALCMWFCSCVTRGRNYAGQCVCAQELGCDGRVAEIPLSGPVIQLQGDQSAGMHNFVVRHGLAQDDLIIVNVRFHLWWFSSKAACGGMNINVHLFSFFFTKMRNSRNVRCSQKIKKIINLHSQP